MLNNILQHQLFSCQKYKSFLCEINSPNTSSVGTEIGTFLGYDSDSIKYNTDPFSNFKSIVTFKNFEVYRA